MEREVEEMLCACEVRGEEVPAMLRAGRSERGRAREREMPETFLEEKVHVEGQQGKARCPRQAADRK